MCTSKPSHPNELVVALETASPLFGSASFAPGASRPVVATFAVVAGLDDFGHLAAQTCCAAVVAAALVIEAVETKLHLLRCHHHLNIQEPIRDLQHLELVVAACELSVAGPRGELALESGLVSVLA
mmetsp:Transcript_12483/g.38086  ORF Transcript_12483/g.38086 Transcript_12483/m.38086 type:complete len:126 (-) Transcript_12483:61-438(-)